jgi:hypothetical protein
VKTQAYCDLTKLEGQVKMMQLLRDEHGLMADMLNVQLANEKVWR